MPRSRGVFLLLSILQITTGDTRSGSAANLSEVGLSCPAGWALVGGKCLKQFSIEQSWNQALVTCSRFGAQLARIESARENTDTAHLLSRPGRLGTKDQFWIGMLAETSSNGDVSFSWSDGSASSRYVGQWQQGQPNHLAGTCALVTLDKQVLTWKLEQYNILLPFVCELPACLKGSFFCASGGCIPEAKHCNGADDCGDFSDELNCPVSRTETACLQYEKGESGKLASPAYPSSYPPNANCRYVIETPINTRIQLTLDYLETEEHVDIVQVLDGGPALNSTTVLASLSGTKSEPLTLHSSTNMLIIRFRSDAAVQGRGFQAHWKAVPFSCGGSLSAQSYGQSVSSPNYPLPYPKGSECVWTIQAAKGQLITLSVEDLQLSGDDKVIIYDGETPSSPVLSILSGNSSANDYFISTGSNLYVYLLTGYESTGRGFSLGYKRGCDIVLKQAYGNVISPGNAVIPYPKSTTCTYTLEMPDSVGEQAFTMTVNRFDMGMHDRLKIYEGSSAKGRALHEEDGFHGGRKPLKQLASRQGSAHIVFTTNAVRSAAGFNITFSLNCPALKTPALVSLSTRNNGYGTKVVVACPSGYEFITGKGRSFDVFCEEGGKWTTDTIPGCQPVYCSAVPQIANGYASAASNVSFGGVVKFSCYEGFAFASGKEEEEIFCTEEGRWTPVPHCRAATCPALTPFVNGERKLEFGEGTGYGTVFRFECRPGFRREGAATLLCRADGKWSAPQPSCKKLPCVNFPSVENGRLAYPTPFLFGDVARVICDSGFVADGPDEVRCLADQTLSVVPTCRDVNECEEGLAQCQESSTTCTNLPGGYSCDCLKGYQPQLVCTSPAFLTPSSVATSSSMPLSVIGGWCASQLDPVKAITLTFPAAKVIEKLRFEPQAQGIVKTIRVRYHAQHGLPLQQLAIDGKMDLEVPDLTAGTNGEYLELPYSIEALVLEISIVEFEEEPCMKVDVAGCQKFSCADINECMKNNGHCDHICVNLQGSYECACRDGFDLFVEDGQGGVKLADDESGSDSNDVVRFNQTCVARSCPHIQSPDNGLLLSTMTSFHFPTVVQFQCDFGHQMMGPDFLQCLADGSWNGTAPFCLPATCQGIRNNSAVGLFVSPDNSTIAYGQNVSVACTQLNRPAKQSTMFSQRQCIYDPQPDGREYWLSGPTAECPLVDCGALPTLAGAEYQGDTSITQVGAALEFACRPPYNLVGKSSHQDKTVRCLVDGTWDLGDLRCEGPVCVDPGFPVDGSVELNAVEEGAVAKFSCDRPGFRPFPSSTLQCQLGAACVLSEDVGISSGFIPDGAFADNSDSSNFGYEPHRARMSSSGWCGSKDAFIFLSVDLQRVYTLTTLRLAGVAGSGHLKGHVTKLQLFYKTQFSQNYDTYPVEFETPSGNHNAMHQFELSPPLRARYLLLGVAEYEQNPCIRFDVLGCLAPATAAHEVPAHLQVGWNGSVPQCVDSEPPAFTNCPKEPIFVQTDEHGQLKPCDYEVPKAEDNSGRVVYTRIEPSGFAPGRPISSDTDVVYTAFDEAGNTAECVVRLRIPDTLPPVMKCPDSYSLAARGPSMNVVFNTTTVPMVIQDVSNISQIVFTPSSADLKIGEHVDVEVSATDVHGNRNKCRFQVAYAAEPCSSDSLSSAENTVKTCVRQDDNLVCSVSCKEGFRFVDEQKVEKNFICQDGKWAPSGAAPACVPIADAPARYELSVALSYPSNSPVPDTCLQGYSSLAERSFHDLGQVLSTRCSSSVEVFVRFLKAQFTNTDGTVIGNYTLLIQPSVPQDVFYDLCGLTLRTIFDLRIPGATTPVKKLLQLAGESIPAQGSMCPQLSAVKSTISQGFGCDDGEVLRQTGKDQLPECLACPAGTVNVNNSCLPCPLGSYQEDSGKTACTACPDATYTQFEGSHSKQSCLAVCGNGMYSETGLVPCQLCPRHTFSGPPVLGGYKECVSCPAGTYTAKLGSDASASCQQPCKAGTFSVTGLEPCSPCPMHQYQPSVGQQSCFACSNTTFTRTTGAATAAQCEIVSCASQKCENRGECVVREHKAMCDCRPGFAGDRCEKGDGVCASKPCYHGGRCEEVAGSFRCHCPANFTGARCQFGVDECSGITCPNGGQCHDLPGAGTHKCLCRTGFAGPDCAEINDICSSANPCRNGADCIPSQLGRYKCRCLPGWEGATCEINIDDCASRPCALNATCVDLINDFECHCPKGFTGKRCNVKEDLCSSNPCEHGLCVDTLFEQKCICEKGWTGERCNQSIDECAEKPCANGGTCLSQESSFSCHCSAGYKGSRCQLLVDHCAASPCKNNATCTNLGAAYHCACPLGFDGVHCEHNIDECSQGRCKSFGTQRCVDGVNSFDCVCNPGYSGELCENKIDQCASSPCENNGTCVDMGGSFRCDCGKGWKGERCEMEAGVCETRPCRNDGHCVALGDDYFCVCPEGVSGRDCEIAPNRCIGEPCLNGGVCGDFGSRLECSCPRQFAGPGCQYAQDVCSREVCHNGGSCEPKGTDGYICQCPPGFTGDHCEANIDDCSSAPCPVGASCIDQLSGVHCRCPMNTTGPLCDKPVDEDYDLRFFDSLRPAVATQMAPTAFVGKQFSLSFWVKFDQPMGKGVVLKMDNSSRSNYAYKPSEILSVDEEKFEIRLFPGENPLTLHFPTTQKINDGKWNHLVFTWSSEGGSYSLMWNAIRLFDDRGYGMGKELTLNVLVTLGSEKSPLAGSITRVYLWKRKIDFESEIPLLSVDCQGAELNFDGLVMRFSGYDKMEGKVEKVPRSLCGREMNKRKDSQKISVDECPADQFIVTSKRETNVSWTEPVFHSKMDIVRVDKNLKPDQVFTWGQYDVMYVAQDNSSTLAECNFKIHVSKEHCPPLDDPVNGVQACEAWGPQLRYKACSIECRDGFDFSRAPSLFYTCSADGVWRPREHRSTVFTYPQCTKTLPATRMVVLRVAYPASSICTDAGKEALRSKLTTSVNDINKKWEICSLVDANGCVGIRVDVDCSSDLRRAKRDTAHALQARIELPIKREMAMDATSGERLQAADAIQNEILTKGAFNLEKVLPNGRPDLSTFQILDQFLCQPGQVVVGDQCVPCAPGSFFSSASSKCELCPEGEYQPLSGRAQCFTCPQGTVTAGPGAINEADCKANCPPGHFFDLTTAACSPCGAGFFQPHGGSFECIPCGVGKTTLSDRATQEEECRDECPDGEQLSGSGSCQPCAVGTFRTRGEQKQCVPCPEGTTTESISSTRREQCNTPRCKPGQFLVKETKHCQFCPRGAFQDQEQQTICKLCPPDHTTAAQGATAESQCYSTNQCATGEDNCSWHALCVDLPDDNDVPSFQCKCKPGYRGNGTHCQDACNNYCMNDGVCKKNPVGFVECICKESFSGERCENRFQARSQRFVTAATGVGIAVGVCCLLAVMWFFGTRRCNKVDDVIEKTPHIDDLPQSNFIYGRPPMEPPRQVGYYYEDEDEYESKTMYVTGGAEDETREQRMRVAQQHMYVPGATN